MRRVAHLLPNMVTGGRERIVADLCRDGAAHGIRPYLLCYEPAGRGERQIAPGDTPIHTLDRRRPAFAADLQAWLTAHRIHILHAQGHIAAALARPGVGAVPMVATLHVALGEGWRWALPIARGLRAAAAVTAVSADLATRFRPLAGQPIAVIPTGVDLDRFTPVARPVAAPAAGRPFTIGIAARLHPVKRHEDAIAALRLLRDRGLPCRLSIAGQGPRRAELARLAAGLDVGFAGDVADMPAWLAGLDAFLLVSDHEGTPAALLEAMASALPCIATAVGGIPALVGNAALLVPPRTPDRVADAVQRLIADAPRRLALAAAARDRAARFSSRRQAIAYADLYDALRAPAALDARPASA